MQALNPERQQQLLPRFNGEGGNGDGERDGEGMEVEEGEVLSAWEEGDDEGVEGDAGEGAEDNVEDMETEEEDGEGEREQEEQEEEEWEEEEEATASLTAASRQKRRRRNPPSGEHGAIAEDGPHHEMVMAKQRVGVGDRLAETECLEALPAQGASLKQLDTATAPSPVARVSAPLNPAALPTPLLALPPPAVPVSKNERLASDLSVAGTGVVSSAIDDIAAGVAAAVTDAVGMGKPAAAVAAAAAVVVVAAAAAVAAATTVAPRGIASIAGYKQPAYDGRAAVGALHTAADWAAGDVAGLIEGPSQHRKVRRPCRPYRCSACRQVKKGHICTAAGAYPAQLPDAGRTADAYSPDGGNRTAKQDVDEHAQGEQHLALAVVGDAAAGGYGGMRSDRVNEEAGKSEGGRKAIGVTGANAGMGENEKVTKSGEQQLLLVVAGEAGTGRQEGKGKNAVGVQEGAFRMEGANGDNRTAVGSRMQGLGVETRLPVVVGTVEGTGRPRRMGPESEQAGGEDEAARLKVKGSGTHRLAVGGGFQGSGKEISGQQPNKTFVGRDCGNRFKVGRKIQGLGIVRSLAVPKTAEELLASGWVEGMVVTCQKISGRVWLNRGILCSCHACKGLRVSVLFLSQRG